MTNDELKALCESNARAIAASNQAIATTNQGIDELKNTVAAFVQRLDDEGLKVTLLRDISDDQAGELAYNSERIEDNEQRIQALRADAIAERIEWRTRFEEIQRQSDKRFEEIQRQSDQRFNEQLTEIRALGEQNRALLSALANTNGRVDSLEQAG